MQKFQYMEKFLKDYNESTTIQGFDRFIKTIGLEKQETRLPPG